MTAVVATADPLKAAVGCEPKLSRESVLQHLFALAFRSLVYPQIWEDPAIDMEALAIQPDDHIVAIASGGCNVLSYLTASPNKITALDLNKAHVALVRLKLAAARHLPSWDVFYGFVGSANRRCNVEIYKNSLREGLDPQSRAYWDARGMFGFGRARIAMFSNNLYRHGLLGRFIGLGHAIARLYGIKPHRFLASRSLEEQRRFFETTVSPLFDKRFVRWAASQRWSLYGLGIPPAQYASLAGDGNMADVLRDRLRRLTCDFSIADNYFAWQAFARGYGEPETAPLPPYLQRNNFAALQENACRLEVLNASFTDYLAASPANSLDCYVLLDAQDWMSSQQLNALWREITRTAKPDARVIFRTAAEQSLLPGRVDESLLSRWHYDQERSADMTRRDRSAIYGGFHLYRLAAA